MWCWQRGSGGSESKGGVNDDDVKPPAVTTTKITVQRKRKRAVSVDKSQAVAPVKGELPPPDGKPPAPRRVLDDDDGEEEVSGYARVDARFPLVIFKERNPLDDKMGLSSRHVCPSWKKFINAGGIYVCTVTVGLHYYFRWPRQQPQWNTLLPPLLPLLILLLLVPPVVVVV